VNDEVLGERVEEIVSNFSDPPRKYDYRLNIQYLVHWALYRPSLYWPVRKAYKSLGSIGIAQSNYNPIDPDQPSPDFGWYMSRGVKKRLNRNMCQINLIDAHSDTVANRYRSEIITDTVVHPPKFEGSRSIYCRYPLRSTAKQDLLRTAKHQNVELADWYFTPIHPLNVDESLTVNYHAGSCPNAETRCKEVVTLPVHRKVGKREVERAVHLINSFAP
jgi:hypothetical protein